MKILISFANLMYNQIRVNSGSTMESESIQIDEMTWDEVKIALNQSKNKVRVYEELSRREATIIHAETKRKVTMIKAQAQEKVVLIKAQAQEKVSVIKAQEQKQVALIKGQQQLEITLAKIQGQKKAFAVQEKLRHMARMEMLTRNKLQQRDEEFKQQQINNQAKRLIQSEVKVRKQVTVSEYLELIQALMKLKEHGIELEDPPQKTNNRSINRNYNSYRYSFRSAQSHKPQMRSQTPKRG